MAIKKLKPLKSYEEIEKMTDLEKEKYTKYLGKRFEQEKENIGTSLDNLIQDYMDEGIQPSFKEICLGQLKNVGEESPLLVIEEEEVAKHWLYDPVSNFIICFKYLKADSELADDSERNKIIMRTLNEEKRK